MTREQFDNLYKNKAVLCKTEPLAKEFLALAHSVGYKWIDGDSLKDGETKWKIWEEQTVYIPEDVYFAKNAISFNMASHAKKDGYNIVEFQSSTQETSKKKYKIVKPDVSTTQKYDTAIKQFDKQLSPLDNMISALIDVVQVEDLPKVKELRKHYEVMAKIIDELK